jgi:hypothetical protein
MLSAGSEEGEAGREKTEVEVRAFDAAEVGHMAVSAPIGRFILIRKGTAVCAVRFTSFRRDYDQKPAGVFSSGDEHKYAEYDWYFQGDGSGDFTVPNVTSGHGSLRDAPSFGLGHYSVKLSATLYVTCGPLKVSWGYPNALVFSTYQPGLRTDYDLELAPTKAADVREIDLKNPGLTWYRLGTQRGAPRFIPLEQLP